MTEQTAIPAPPAPEPEEKTGDYVCPNCLRWFPTLGARTKHTIKSHPEAALK